MFACDWLVTFSVFDEIAPIKEPTTRIRKKRTDQNFLQLSSLSAQLLELLFDLVNILPLWCVIRSVVFIQTVKIYYIIWGVTSMKKITIR